MAESKIKNQFVIKTFSGTTSNAGNLYTGFDLSDYIPVSFYDGLHILIPWTNTSGYIYVKVTSISDQTVIANTTINGNCLLMRK